MTDKLKVKIAEEPKSLRITLWRGQFSEEFLMRCEDKCNRKFAKKVIDLIVAKVNRLP